MQADTRTCIEIPGETRSPGTRGLDQDPFRFRRLRVLFYRVIPDTKPTRDAMYYESYSL
jgi:hypothetical protein